MAENGRYDDALSGILQCEGQILPFLESIYGFLYRRTDFYRIQHTSTERLGFPEGIAEKISRSAFMKFKQLSMEDEEKLKRFTQNQQMEVEVMEPLALQEVEIGDSSVVVEEISEKSYANHPIRVHDEKPIREMTQEDFQKLPESYNGAIRDNYQWSQKIKEIDVRINVEPHVQTGKQVRVKIDCSHLKVEYVDKEGEWQTIIDGDLGWKVNTEESLWTLMPGDHIHVSMEKIQERWWDGLLKDEPTIDVKKIDNSRPFSDLDEAAQYKIEELMYNEKQKALGLPTPQQSKINDILKDAWNKEGSPFKGTPFDPTTVNMSNPQDLAASLAKNR